MCPQVLVVAVAAGVHVFVYLHYLPFYQPFANQLHTVFATVFAWGSLCLLVAQFRVGSGVSGPYLQAGRRLAVVGMQGTGEGGGLWGSVLPDCACSCCA